MSLCLNLHGLRWCVRNLEFGPHVLCLIPCFVHLQWPYGRVRHWCDYQVLLNWGCCYWHVWRVNWQRGSKEYVKDSAYDYRTWSLDDMEGALHKYEKFSSTFDRCGSLCPMVVWSDKTLEKIEIPLHFLMIMSFCIAPLPSPCLNQSCLRTKSLPFAKTILLTLGVKAMTPPCVYFGIGLECKNGWRMSPRARQRQDYRRLQPSWVHGSHKLLQTLIWHCLYNLRVFADCKIGESTGWVRSSHKQGREDILSRFNPGPMSRKRGAVRSVLHQRLMKIWTKYLGGQKEEVTSRYSLSYAMSTAYEAPDGDLRY